MESSASLPVFNIGNFDDYNNCMCFEDSFYVRKFSEHLKENKFVEEPHGHDFFLMLVVTKGRGKHIIDFTEYEVTEGSMFILSPGQIHQWILSEDVEGYILFFTKEFFLHDFDTSRLNRFPFFNSTFSSPFFKLTEKQTTSVLEKYHLMCSEYRSRNTDFQEIIRMYLNAMLMELTRYYPEKKKDKYTLPYDIVQLNKFEALVDKYFKLHRPLSCYAERMHISERQLSYLCKKTINKKPSEIMTERVILEAKRLIIHSSLSIAAISEELNYNDSSYFIRLFKKVTKQTPEQFRNEQFNRVFRNKKSTSPNELGDTFSWAFV